jgi:hypothetical protein
MKITVFVALMGLEKKVLRFQRNRLSVVSVKETLVSFNQSTWHHISGDSNLHSHKPYKPKTRSFIFLSFLKTEIILTGLPHCLCLIVTITDFKLLNQVIFLQDLAPMLRF